MNSHLNEKIIPRSKKEIDLKILVVDLDRTLIVQNNAKSKNFDFHRNEEEIVNKFPIKTYESNTSFSIIFPYFFSNIFNKFLKNTNDHYVIFITAGSYEKGPMLKYLSNAYGLPENTFEKSYSILNRYDYGDVNTLKAEKFKCFLDKYDIEVNHENIFILDDNRDHLQSFYELGVPEENCIYADGLVVNPSFVRRLGEQIPLLKDTAEILDKELVIIDVITKLKDFYDDWSSDEDNSPLQKEFLIEINKECQSVSSAIDILKDFTEIHRMIEALVIRTNYFLQCVDITGKSPIQSAHDILQLQKFDVKPEFQFSQTSSFFFSSEQKPIHHLDVSKGELESEESEDLDCLEAWKGLKANLKLTLEKNGFKCDRYDNELSYNSLIGGKIKDILEVDIEELLNNNKKNITSNTNMF